MNKSFGTILLRRILHFFLLALGLPISTLVAQYRPATAEDFRARNLPGKYYTEYWEYAFVLNESILLNYTFFISDIGTIRERTIGVRMVIVMPGKKPHVVNKDYAPEHFVHDPANFLLRPHPQRDFVAKNLNDSTHWLLFRTGRRQREYHVQLTMENMLPGMIRSTMDIHPELGQFGVHPIIARADAKGFIVIDSDSIAVSGTGFMDHVYYANLPHRIFETGYSLKNPSKKDGFSLAVLQQKHANWNKKVGSGTQFSWSAYNKNSAPMQLPDSMPANQPFGQIFEYTLLSELPGMKRFVAKNLLGQEMIEVYQLVKIDGTVGVKHSFYVK